VRKWRVATAIGSESSYFYSSPCFAIRTAAFRYACDCRRTRLISSVVSIFAPLMRSPAASTAFLELSRRLARGSFWSLLSNGIGQGLSLLASVVTARYLGVVDFGKLGVVLTTVTMFAAVGSAGMGVAVTKHVAQFRKEDPGRAGRIIGMSSATAAIAGALVCIVLISVAPWLAANALVAPTLVRELRISALILFFASVNGYQLGALAGFEAFRAAAAANFFRGLVGFPILVAGAAYGGLTGAVFATGLVTAISCWAHGTMLRRQCRSHGVPVSYDLCREDFRILYRFCLPVLIAELSYMPALWASNAALARGAGYSETGLFHAAFQWQTVCMFLAVGVGNVGFPMLAANLMSQRWYLSVLVCNFCLTMGLTLVSALIAVLLAPQIAALYGDHFGSAASVIRIFCVCSVVLALHISAGTVIWSLDAAGPAMLFALLRGGVLVAASFLLSQHGAQGIAWAHLITATALALSELPYAIIRLRKFRLATV